jgi:hypothetical protein
VQLSGISKISGALALLLKAAIQFIMLVWFLGFKIPRPDVFLVQVRLRAASVFAFVDQKNYMNYMTNHYHYQQLYFFFEII